MNRIDKMRQKQSNRPTVQAPKPGAPPVVGEELVSAACGHPVPFPLFEDRKDKFRDARRKKLADRDCPACRQAKHTEATQAQQVEAEARRAANPNPKKVSSRRVSTDKLDAQHRDKGRLPHGARIEVQYDAERVEWRGVLVVEGERFETEAGALFRLLTRLDDKYRASLKNKPAGPSAPAPQG